MELRLMPVTDEERLVVAIEARIAQFEKNMLRAERTGSQSFTKLRGSSKSATQQMEADMIRSTTRINQALATTSASIGAFGKAFAIGATTAAFTGFTAAVKASIESTANLGRQARMANVDLERFQELKFVAEQNRIGVDALVDGFKELSIRADEFVQTGAGGGAEAFQRLGYSSEDLARKLKNPSDLFLEIIGRVKDLDRAAQVRIFDEIFGGQAGERFVELVEQGEQGIRDQIKAANDLGLVMNKELVQRAEEVDKKFNIIANTIGTRIKAAIIDAVSAWSRFIDEFNTFEEQKKSTLQFRQSELGMERVELENQIMQTPKSEEMVLRKLKARMDMLNAEDRQITDTLATRQAAKPATPATTTTPVTPRDLGADYMREYRDELAKTNRERLISTEIEKILSDASSKGVKLTKEQAAALAEESVARTERDAAAKKAAKEAGKDNEYDRGTQQIRERIDVLRAETEAQRAINPLIDDHGLAVEAAAAKQELLNAAQRAGITVTPELAKEIENLSTTYGLAVQESQMLAEKQDEIRQRAEEAMDQAKDVTKGFILGMIDGRDAADLVVDGLKKIADALLDDVLNSIFKVQSASGGSGGGFLSGLMSIFGGGLGGGSKYFPPAPKVGMYATGGVAKEPSIFAEAGPEAAVPLPDGRRIPVDLGNSGAGGSMDVKVDVGVSIDENGNLQAYVKNVSRQESANTIGRWSGSEGFARAVGGAMPKVNKRRV
jgi:hypothetical protein